MPEQLPHIYLKGPDSTIPYTTVPSGGGSENPIERNRKTHGEYIQSRLTEAWNEAENEIAVYESTRAGVYIEFQSPPNLELANSSLENIRKNIRLCNIRKVGDTSFVTVYIPNIEKELFFNRVSEYLNNTRPSGKPYHAKLIEGIEDLRKALLVESFWVDDRTLMPKEEKEWCEVWLRGDSDEVVNQFETQLDDHEIKYKNGNIKFPERIVKLILVSATDLELISSINDNIAEYRKAKVTADFLLNETPAEQAKWVEDLINRIEVNDTSEVAICILDTGVNYSHPLLQPILDSNDCQTVNESWGSDDKDNHGTLMAGLAGYGDLKKAIEGSHQVKLNHKLESVKIFNPNEQTSPELWGYYTSEAISLAEIVNPERKRISCLAVTSKDVRDQGKPSSWSGAVDQIISGSDGSDKRLLIVAAGNSTAIDTDLKQIAIYPDSQITDSIHDPGQAWNALTVGAFTQLATLTDSIYSDYSPVAKENELSPFSTTSNIWERQWPIKPEVVFEGGNIAVNASGEVTEADDLRLISTNHTPQEELLCHFSMTSAATAQASNFAATIQNLYPDYWPETIRALMVHSAEWTKEMKEQFARNENKTELLNVLRSCGYGVPDIDRALYCANNSLTLISEATIQPFCKQGSQYKTKDMHLYELPWPSEILEELGENEVELRITLSYFIEPGPGQIGWKDRYRYQSHGLRFDLNLPTESKEEFINKINAASRADDYDSTNSSSASVNWKLGKNQRDRGSIHSDIWKGTAQDLSSSKYIAVFPRIGWWRERQYLNCFDKATRYALIISIKTEASDVDIYTPVMTSVSVPISIET